MHVVERWTFVQGKDFTLPNLQHKHHQVPSNNMNIIFYPLKQHNN